MAVLLPAPFGPRKPKISPASTERLKLSRARRRRLLAKLRYSFVTLSNSSTKRIVVYSKWLALRTLPEQQELAGCGCNFELTSASRPGIINPRATHNGGN